MLKVIECILNIVEKLNVLIPKKSKKKFIEYANMYGMAMGMLVLVFAVAWLNFCAKKEPLVDISYSLDLETDTMKFKLKTECENDTDVWIKQHTQLTVQYEYRYNK